VREILEPRRMLKEVETVWAKLKVQGDQPGS
jgi:hypothetical protein